MKSYKSNLYSLSNTQKSLKNFSGNCKSADQTRHRVRSAVRSGTAHAPDLPPVDLVRSWFLATVAAKGSATGGKILKAAQYILSLLSVALILVGLTAFFNGISPEVREASTLAGYPVIRGIGWLFFWQGITFGFLAFLFFRLREKDDAK